MTQPAKQTRIQRSTRQHASRLILATLTLGSALCVPGVQAQRALPRVSAPVSNLIDLLNATQPGINPLSLTIPELQAEMAKRGIAWKKYVPAVGSVSGAVDRSKIAPSFSTGKVAPYTKGAGNQKDGETTQPDGKQPDGPPEIYEEKKSDGNMLCSTQRYKLWESPPEYAMKSLDQDLLWVGSFVKTAGLQSGSMQPINIPASQRKGIQLTTATGGMGTIIHSTVTDYNVAVMAVRQGLVNLGGGAAGPGYGTQVSYALREQSTTSSTALDVKLNANLYSFNVNADGGLSSEQKKHTVSAVFVQNAFTVVADTQGQDAKAAFLQNPVADGNALDQGAYINSITYGRMIFVEMTSSYSSVQMKAALDASYSKISTGMAYNSSKILQESTFKVYAAGGNENGVIATIKSKNLADYFEAPVNAMNLVPISFTARNVSNDSYAASQLAGDYAETVCNPNSVTVGVRVKLQMIEPDDKKGDKVYGSINLNGSNIWNSDKKSTILMTKGNILNLFTMPTPLVMNYGEARTMTLDGYAKDHDALSKDDPIGNWNSYIDLKAVAQEFKDGKNFVTREFISKLGKKASTKIVIEFFR